MNVIHKVYCWLIFIVSPSYQQWSHKQKTDTRQELFVSPVPKKPRSHRSLKLIIDVENLNAVRLYTSISRSWATFLCYSRKMTPFHAEYRYRKNVLWKAILLKIFLWTDLKACCAPQQSCLQCLVKVDTKYVRRFLPYYSPFYELRVARFVL